MMTKMTTRNEVIGLVLCLLATSTALAQPLPTVAVPQDVEHLLKDYARAWAANDPDALARLFAPRPLAFGASDELAYVIGGFGAAPDKPAAG
jgi:hypothetical protein